MNKMWNLKTERQDGRNAVKNFMKHANVLPAKIHTASNEKVLECATTTDKSGTHKN